MNKDQIERLAGEILIAMYGNPATEQKDYRHNAMVAFNAALALSHEAEYTTSQKKETNEHNS